MKSHAKALHVIKKWELLRIPYCLILITIILIGVFPIRNTIPNKTIFIIENVIGLIQANILYFLGPLIEIGAKYKSIDLSHHRILIWSFGTLFSAAVSIYSVMMVYNRFT